MRSDLQLTPEEEIDLREKRKTKIVVRRKRRKAPSEIRR